MCDDNEKNIDNNNESYTICPDCGRPITTENDAGNGFCKDCAPNH